jgi:GAF domain-containing protein
MTDVSSSGDVGHVYRPRYPSVDEALISLCERVEGLVPGSIAGMTICNRARTHIERALFPKLPDFADAIRSVPLVPMDFGSCVRAVSQGEIITCPDLESEMRFDPSWRKLCLDHGLRSLQSRPVYLRDRKPFASFVLAFREPRPETDWNAALMTFAADAAGLALQDDLDRSSIAPE